MKNVTKKRLFAVLFIALLTVVVTLCGCGKYTSSYKATAMVRTNTSKNASLSFSQLEGTVVFKLKCGDDGKIDYTAKLGEGGVKIYYDCDGTKTELVAVNSGNDVSDTLTVRQAGTVYIVIEAPEPAKDGKFTFEVK